MKSTIIRIAALAAVLTAGCSEPDAEKASGGFGKLRIEGAADGRVDAYAASDGAAEGETPGGTTPSGSAFALRIAGNELDRTWETVADFAAEDPLIREGDYEATIAWGDPMAEGADLPYYEGTKAFRIAARRETRVEITATLANSQATVRTTEQFDRYFGQACFTLTTAAGNEFEFRPASGTDQPVYIQAKSSVEVAGTAVRPTGETVTFPAQHLAQTKPRTRHTFTFDAPDAGSVRLTIGLDDTFVEIIEFPVELNDGAISGKE